MPYPNRKLEKKLNKKGFILVAGVDEAGKGSWAGPIVAAAVILDPKIKIKGVKDSKLLSVLQRKDLFQEIKNKAIAFGVGEVSAAMIDKIGITAANKLAMQRAIEKLNPKPQYILVDAVKLELEIPSEAIIDGDYKIASIAAASIIAKVHRDNLMEKLDEKFPRYSFKQHKGYGTNHHFHMLNQYGPCEIHRKTFKPIKDLLNS